MSDINSPGAPNVPDWSEDANSPITQSNGTLSGSPADDYDEWLILADIVGDTDDAVTMTINSVTEYYAYIDAGGGQTSSASSWPFGNMNLTRGGKIRARIVEPTLGDFGRITAFFEATGADNVSTSAAVRGVQRGETDAPLDTFEIDVANGNITDGRAVLLGRNQ